MHHRFAHLIHRAETLTSAALYLLGDVLTHRHHA